MEPPQKNVGGDGAGLQHLQQQFALGFDDDLRQQWRERLVLGRRCQRCWLAPCLVFDQRLNGLLPGARGDAVVGAGQIGLGDLEIEHRLALGLVLGLDDLAGLVLVVVPRLVRLPVSVSTQ